MADPLYELEGSNQVEPNASAWWSVPQLKAINPREIVHRFTDRQYAPSDVAFKRLEPYLLSAQATANPKANEPASFAPAPKLSQLLTHPRFLDHIPAGAVIKGGIVSTPVELASLFEGETPGLWHRHVLNVLLDPSVKNGAGLTFSPPRQALIWAALDMAIASALQAAWYFKWVGMTNPRKKIEYRQRPAEFAGKDYSFIYDLVVQETTGGETEDSKFSSPRIKRVTRKTKNEDMPNVPSDFPGSPRHPAFPSGHSTYSAAASKVLGCFFNGYDADDRFKNDGKSLDWVVEFDALADNIGTARLYGGVHWVDDHEFGQELGLAVGTAVMDQLSNSGIEPRLKIEEKRPIPEEMVRRYSELPSQPSSNFCAPQPVSSKILQNVQIL